MLWIHPVLQLLCTLMALHVTALGVQRFRASHLKHKVMFNWKAHVRYGRIVLIVWALALVLGLAVCRGSWGGSGYTGAHFYVGLAMLPLIAIGFVSGEILDRFKKRRKALPLVHGVNNALLLALALYQVVSGVEAIKVFLLP